MASVGHRTADGFTKCPFCAGKRITPERNLLALFPAVAKEWDAIRNGIDASQVAPFSNKRFWFTCSKGHSWQTRLTARTNSGAGCPYCANQKVCTENSLATIAPDIAQEWHPTKNGSLTPSEVLFGSKKRAWFKCVQGHEWAAPIDVRFHQKTGCPFCHGPGKSFGEEKVAKWLTLHKIEFERQKRFEGCRNKNPLPFDFYLPFMQICIEYDGIHHFKPWYGDEVAFKRVQKHDKIKEQFCFSSGIALLRISCFEFRQLETLLQTYFP